MRFLVVDDDAAICRGTARRLINMKHPSITEVAVAFSGEEALAHIREHPLDVLYTDIRMDEMDGLALIEAAKAVQPALVCVILSAYDDFAYAKTAIRLGVEDFLVKPCSLEDMKRTTLQVIARCREQATHRRLRLDASLDELLSGKPGDVRQVFSTHGRSIPRGELCLAAFPDTGAELPTELWWYPLRRQQACLFIAAEDMSTWETLDIFCRDKNISLGICRATVPLGDMLLHGREALSIAWFYGHPKVIEWKGNIPCSHYDAEPLFRQVRSLQPEAVRDSLYALVHTEGDAAPWILQPLLPRLYDTLREAAKENEIAVPPYYVLPPHSGWIRAVDAATEVVRDARQALLAQSKLDPIAFARRYMREHLDEHIDMGVVANILDMSYSHFSKIFHDQTGETFQEHLLRLRMEEACRLLRRGYKVNQIADSLGYQSANNFTRSFTKYHGVSPRDWRQREGD